MQPLPAKRDTSFARPDERLMWTGRYRCVVLVRWRDDRSGLRPGLLFDVTVLGGEVARLRPAFWALVDLAVDPFPTRCIPPHQP